MPTAQKNNLSTVRLSKSMTDALNKQMTKEAHAAQIYLSYGVWADDEGYSGVSNFLFRHAHEERNHMTKIMQYILERGAKPDITAIAAPPPDPADMNDCFHKVFEHEVSNTESVYKIVKMSFDEQDWATWNFMQWFVKEQIEEEKLALELLDKIKIAGGEKAGRDALFSINQELAEMPDEAPLARAAREEKPV